MDTISRFLAFPLEDLPFVFLALVIAFTVHEFAHAYAAYKFGDPTAKNQGRVTLNPRSHLDVLGTIFIFIAGFGWAKPVPVNRSMFKHPRLMGVVTSAVGPLSNLLIAFTAILIARILISAGWATVPTMFHSSVEIFLSVLIELNIILFIFNLIPLPPLDGYRIVEDLVPHRTRARMSQYEQWGIFIFLLMVFIPPLRHVTIDPLFLLKYDIIEIFKWILSF
jgi:Zn-dependent protease